MANDVSIVIGIMIDFLEKLPKDTITVRYNAIKFGKEIKGYPYKSKTQSLTRAEIQNYTRDLINIYKHWARLGDKNWKVKEVEGMRFTIKFTRTDCNGTKLPTYLEVEE